MPDDAKSGEQPISNMQDILEKSWNESIGEDRNEIPDERHHLTDVLVEGGDDDKKENISSQDESSQTPPEKKEAEAGAQQEPTGQQPAGDTREAPQHWSAEDRATFAKLDQAGQEFLLRRHREMEGDYTRKTQEHAETVKYGKAFRDYMESGTRQALAGSGVTDEQFLGHLLQYHRLSMVNPEEFVRQTVRNLNVDPAKVFNLQPEGKGGQAKPAPADPTIQRIAAIEQRLTSEDQARQTRMANEAKTEMEVFRDEKDSAGQPLRPHFEKVRTMMGRLMMADPSLDMKQAYEVAVFRDPELRAASATPPPAQPAPAGGGGQLSERKVKEAEAAMAARRSNIRSGNGAGIDKNSPADGKNKSLREVLKDAADEVGFN